VSLIDFRELNIKFCVIKGLFQSVLPLRKVLDVLLLVLKFHLKHKLLILTLSLYLTDLAKEEIETVLGASNGWQKDKNTRKKNLHQDFHDLFPLPVGARSILTAATPERSRKGFASSRECGCFYYLLQASATLKKASRM
jgi:hypothetical protein